MLALYHANRIHQQQQQRRQQEQQGEGAGGAVVAAAASAAARLPPPPKGRIGLGGQVGGLGVLFCRGDLLLFTAQLQK